MAQIILTEEECIEMFYNALCNGTQIIGQHGLELDWNSDEYTKAGGKLKEAGKSPCIEDVVIQILKDGGELQIIDVEGGEEDSEYTRSITLKEVIERVPKIPMQHLIDMIYEHDDAITADVILQTVFYEEVIFG